MAKPQKTCSNCGYSCDPPLGIKPMYGAGGMMLACCKPGKRKNGLVLVAPEYTCRSWVREEEKDER